MTEEVIVETSEEIVPEQQNQEPEVSAVEQRALEMGWRPKDDFDGAEEDFIDAQEFVRRRPLFDKIETQSRELKAVRKSLEAFKEHYTTVQKTEYERALKDLKASQKVALAEGDIDKYHALGEAREAVEEEARTRMEEVDEITVDDPVAPHPEFQAWMNRNPWYTSDEDMAAFADALGQRLAAKGTDKQEVLKRVEASVRKAYPEKFRNSNKDTAPAVEGKKTQRTNVPAKDTFVMTEQEIRAMNGFVRDKVLTKEQYISDLKKAKGLE